MKNWTYTYSLCLLILVGTLQSCIKNDIDYPKIALEITGISVDGQNGNPIISTTDRTVIIQVDETVDLRKVHVKTFSTTGDAKSTLAPESVIDLTKPYSVTLSLYQDYEWSIIGQQDIPRTYVLENQIGVSELDVTRLLAVASVTKETKWKDLTLKALKLGPEGSTYNGAEGLPDLNWAVYANYAEAAVEVKYKNFFSETWKLRVYRKEVNAVTKQADGWVNVAWLYGEGLEGADNGFEMREASSATWVKVDQAYITINGAAFTARIPHLKEQTTYHCRAYSGEDKGKELTFTTGEVRQLPNAKFDDWHQNGKIYNPWLQGGQSFWDTGNTGSSILRNITTPDQNSTWDNQLGTSVKMESMWAVIKFAAGNLFAGSWVSLVNGTDGHLRFGREFTERPTKLRGHYKYTSFKINRIPSPSSDMYEKLKHLKDEPDTCIVWVALGDWDAPVDIITSSSASSRKLFDKNDSHVIAYGEFIKGQTVSQFEPFEVEFKYKATNRVPKYLLVVCSSSKYGDYFTGAEYSTLWVDDFTLEYDYDD